VSQAVTLFLIAKMPHIIKILGMLLLNRLLF